MAGILKINTIKQVDTPGGVEGAVVIDTTLQAPTGDLQPLGTGDSPSFSRVFAVGSVIQTVFATPVVSQLSNSTTTPDSIFGDIAITPLKPGSKLVIIAVIGGLYSPSGHGVVFKIKKDSGAWSQIEEMASYAGGGGIMGTRSGILYTVDVPATPSTPVQEKWAIGFQSRAANHAANVSYSSRSEMMIQEIMQ